MVTPTAWAAGLAPTKTLTGGWGVGSVTMGNFAPEIRSRQACNSCAASSVVRGGFGAMTIWAQAWPSFTRKASCRDQGQAWAVAAGMAIAPPQRAASNTAVRRRLQRRMMQEVVGVDNDGRGGVFMVKQDTATQQASKVDSSEGHVHGHGLSL